MSIISSIKVVDTVTGEDVFEYDSFESNGNPFKTVIETGQNGSAVESKIEISSNGVDFKLGTSDNTTGVNFVNSDGTNLFKISGDNIQDTTSTTGKCPLYIECNSGQIYRYMANGGNNSSDGWVIQNGQKYYIDKQNRMYRLLLRQDMEKTITGDPQTSAGWPTNAIISSTKEYNNTADPQTAHQFLDFSLTTAEWDEYRDEDGKLEFKKIWPDIETRFPYDASRPINFEDSSGNVVDWMTWKQTSEPGQGVDFEQIDEDNNLIYYNANSSNASTVFEGIHLDSDSNAFLDGNNSNLWFYGAGIFDTYNTSINGQMGGLTAMPILVMSNGSWLYHTKVEVWLRVPNRVYLVAGQSNAVGFGVESQLPSYISPGQTLSNVKYWGNGYSAWSDMVAGNTNASRYFGYELPLGYLTHPSYIIKYASGGTNLHTQWDPDGANNSIYDAWLTTVTNALNALTVPYQIVGMAWMQGESDSNTGNASNYETNLTEFISSVRTAVGFPKLRFGIGKIYAPNGNQTYINIIRSAQQSVADADDNIFTIETNDLSLHDNIHYDGTSLITMAERFISGFGPITVSTPNTPATFYTKTDQINTEITWHKLLSQDVDKDINTDISLSTPLSWTSSVIQNGYLNKNNPTYGNYANFDDGFSYVRNINNNLVLKIEWGSDTNNWEYIEQSSLPVTVRNGLNQDTDGFIPTYIISKSSLRNRGVAISTSNNTWLDTDAAATWWGALGMAMAGRQTFSGGIPAISSSNNDNIIPKTSSIWMAITGISTVSNRPNITVLDYDNSGRWWKKLIGQDLLKDYLTNAVVTATPWDPRIVLGHMWNKDKPWCGNYINLNIDYSKHIGIFGTISNSHYQFRLNYPGSGDNLIFDQKNKPLETVDGFILREVTGGGNGLSLEGISPEIHSNSWLSGRNSIINNWWYAIGVFGLHQNGIPGVEDMARIVTNVNLWIKTLISSSTDVFAIGKGLPNTWHYATPVGIYNTESTPINLNYIYNVVPQKTITFDAVYLQYNSTNANQLVLRRYSSEGDHGLKGQFYIDITNSKNTDLRDDILNNYICIVMVIEVFTTLAQSIVISNFAESIDTSGNLTSINTVNMNVDYGVNTYELKNTIQIPSAIPSNLNGYRVGLSISDGLINTDYINLLGFRIEIQ